MTKPANRNGLRWTEDESNHCAALIARGMSYADIAAELGRTEGAVEDRAKELGTHTPKRVHVLRLWTAEEDQDLIRLWRSGYTDEQIAKILERRSPVGVRERRRILDLSKPTAGRPTPADKAERAEPEVRFSPFAKPDLFALWDERNTRLRERLQSSTQQS